MFVCVEIPAECCDSVLNLPSALSACSNSSNSSSSSSSPQPQCGLFLPPPQPPSASLLQGVGCGEVYVCVCVAVGGGRGGGGGGGMGLEGAAFNAALWGGAEEVLLCAQTDSSSPCRLAGAATWI